MLLFYVFVMVNHFYTESVNIVLEGYSVSMLSLEWKTNVDCDGNQSHPSEEVMF